MSQTSSTIQREGFRSRKLAISNGNLKALKCGKRTLVLRDDLREFLASLPGAA